MTYNIRTTLRAVAMNEKNIERPSVLLHRLKDIIYSYNIVERHVTVNLNDVVRDVLLSEFTDEYVSPRSSGIMSVIADLVSPSHSPPCVVRAVNPEWLVSRPFVLRRRKRRRALRRQC
jgi:hypothetical protein